MDVGVIVYLGSLVLLDAEENERTLSQLWLISTKLFVETRKNASMNQAEKTIGLESVSVAHLQ